MMSFVRRWHVVLAVIFGIYLAIPKPTTPFYTFGANEELPEGTELISDEGVVAQLVEDLPISEDEQITVSAKKLRIDWENPINAAFEDEYKTNDSFVFTMNEGNRGSVRDSSKAGFALQFPLADYRWNLGQDLQGGTSLRYHVKSTHIEGLKSKIGNIYRAWYGNSDETDVATRNELPASVQEKLKVYFDTNRLQFPSLDSSEVESINNNEKLPKAEREEFASFVQQLDTAERDAAAQNKVTATVETLTRRLNASGMTELNIIPHEAQEMIEVKLPAIGREQIERLKGVLQSTGSLEFLLLPADDVFGDGSAQEFYDDNKRLPEVNGPWYEWYQVLPSQTAADLFTSDRLVPTTEADGTVVWKDDESRTSAVFHYPKLTAVATDRAMERVRFTTKQGEEKIALVRPEAILAQVKHPLITNAEEYPIQGGNALKDATASSSDSGRPAVSFTLKGRAVSTMATITEAHKQGSDDPRGLAVAIDKKIYSAPSINATLSDQIQVSGDFTRSEVRQYVDTLKSGQLDVTLELIGEETMGPAEGADNVSRGVWSILIGALMVFIFAVVIYRRTGVLTIFNLVLTVLLIVAIMSMFLSTLTLPGIAGLVLTLGMAIDANILINERIKEERRRGAKGKAAIKAGFDKAFSAIVDGNVTTLITSVILAKVGTGAVAGFALTLSIGILCTLYTALVCYKTTMFFCYDKGIITEVRGWNLFANKKFNILGVGGKLAIVNLVLMLAAFSFFIIRPDEGGTLDSPATSENLGIDFRGGAQIMMSLKTPMLREGGNEEIPSVASVIANIKDEAGIAKYPNVQIQLRTFLGEDAEKAALEGGTRFELRFPQRADHAGVTADELEQQVLADLHVAFKDVVAENGFATSIPADKVATAEMRAVFELQRPKNVLVTESRNWLELDYLFKDAESYKFDDLKADVFSKVSTDPTGVEDGDKFEITVSPRLIPLDTEVKKGIPDVKQQIEVIVRNIRPLATDATTTLEALKLAFYNKLKKEFYEDLSAKPELRLVMAPEGLDFPVMDNMISAVETSGRLQIDIALLSAVRADDTVDGQGQSQKDGFRSTLEGLVRKLNHPLFDAPGVMVEAVEGVETESKELMARRYRITTGLGKLEGAAQEAARLQGTEGLVEKHFQEVGSDNHITDPFPRSSVIGGRVAGETQARALLALIIALVMIVIYIAVRFKSAGWGYAAVAALVHDSLFTLGAIAICDWFIHDIKIDLTAIAALLTVIGYSLNDTIVIFDRIREELVDDLNSENQRPLSVVINNAINNTLSRTLLTSLSTFVVVISMLAIGGPAIRTFALTLFFGLIFGTYSSVFRAGPFLLFFTGRRGDIRSEIEAEEKARKEAEAAEREALAAISVDRDMEDDDEDEGAKKED